MHSRLSDGERYDEWRKIREGRASVVVGARSAVFAPFNRLGLIIMDEEHEGSYKQEETPKYHARDVAIHRAQLTGAPSFCSATPSLESYHAARSQAQDDFAPHLLEMPSRALGNKRPRFRSWICGRSYVKAIAPCSAALCMPRFRHGWNAGNRRCRR